jgi:quercetin dioxygenase-like cupin family protein
MSSPAFVLMPGETRSGPSGGTWSTRLSGVDTGRLLTIGEADMAPMSAGPPLHVHANEDEASLVVEGVLTVQLGGERYDVPAGGIAWLARGVPHTFANLTAERVRVFGVIAPAGLEEMFEAINAYVLASGGRPDPARIMEINERYGVTALGPPIEVPAAPIARS